VNHKNVHTPPCYTLPLVQGWGGGGDMKIRIIIHFSSEHLIRIENQFVPKQGSHSKLVVSIITVCFKFSNLDTFLIVMAVRTNKRVIARQEWLMIGNVQSHNDGNLHGIYCKAYCKYRTVYENLKEFNKQMYIVV
jgi:hypothetical protein